MRLRHAAPVIGLVFLIVAGCTTTSEGEPSPATTTETGEVSTESSTAPTSSDVDDLPSDGAPKVDEPLDTTRFQQDPCTVLTASQAQQELNLSPQGEPEDVAYGNGCNWSNPQSRGLVSIEFLTGNTRGLSALYAANERGEYPYFVEMPPVEGYPAVASDIEDRRPRGICIVAVGVTDELIFDVYLQLSQANVGKVEPCEMAARVAGLALRTMKAGS